VARPLPPPPSCLIHLQSGRFCKTCEYDVCGACCDAIRHTEANGFGDKTGIDSFIVQLVGEAAW